MTLQTKGKGQAQMLSKEKSLFTELLHRILFLNDFGSKLSGSLKMKTHFDRVQQKHYERTTISPVIHLIGTHFLMFTDLKQNFKKEFKLDNNVYILFLSSILHFVIFQVCIIVFRMNIHYLSSLFISLYLFKFVYLILLLLNHLKQNYRHLTSKYSEQAFPKDSLLPVQPLLLSQLRKLFLQYPIDIP